MNDFECGEFFFSSNFDSGNLRQVELVRSCSEAETAENIVHVEFDLWTTPDCYGTPYENPNRTWFFFSIKGGKPYRNVKINVRNLNRQAKLFSQGMAPVMRVGENGKWERIKDKPTYSTERDCFYISFIHRTSDTPEMPHYYAFTYPFTYTEGLVLLDKFDRKYGKNSQDTDYIINRIVQLEKEERENAGGGKKTDPAKGINVVTKVLPKDQINTENTMDDMNTLSPTAITDTSGGDSSSQSLSESLYEKMSKRELQNEIYFHRELLIHSLQKRRVDLVTISSYHGIQSCYEERLSKLFPEMAMQRCRVFKDKKIIFLSSRVHPGETAASFVLNGFLNLILDRKSIIGQALRQLYVFKIVPFLNPDGVYNGLYRTDTLGQNLNRMYICPQIDRQPSIYAVKKLIKFYHLGYDGFDEENNKLAPIELKKPIASPFVAKDCPEKSDAMCSTTSLYDLVEKIKTETEVESTTLTYSSKDTTTSSEGEENNSPACIESIPSSIQAQVKVFTEQLIPELKAIAQEPLPKKLLPAGSTTFGKKTSEHMGRKGAAAFKTVFGTNHGGIGGARNGDTKLKDLQNTTTQRTKFKKSLIRKEVKGGTQSNLTLKAMNKKNLLCCQNIDISVEHSSKSCDDGITDRADKSNLFLYMDFHGHASKKGIFMYGNHFQSTHEAVECMLLPRLMAVNCHHFHYDACNFSERNMYRREKRDGLSKEGSGRVAVFKMTGLIKCYTLESNYNTGKYVNTLPNRSKESNQNQKPPYVVPPKYTPAIYEEAGRAIGPSILDITNSNSISRIYNSEYRSIQALRIALRNEIERHGSQRSVANSGKIISSPQQQHVKRVKRNSLSSATPSNDMSKENKAIYHHNIWDLAVPSSSTQTASLSLLQSLNPSSSKLPPRPTRSLKRNPLKAHSTNLYGKKDVTVTKKKPKPVVLLDSASCSTTKKDHGFPIPPKKVRVSPTLTMAASKEHSPPKRKTTTSTMAGAADSSSSSESGFKSILSENPLTFETSTSFSNVILPTSGSADVADSTSSTSSSDRASQAQLKSEKQQFYTASSMSLKKCTSESVLDIYATKSDSGVLPSSSASILSYKSSNTIDDAVASCSPRMIVHSSNTNPILSTFRKTKKADSFLLKSSGAGGVGGVGQLTAALTPKMKNAFGGSEGSKLVKKKRIIRHDSLIGKRKKNKSKITRH